jgi:hypothetical protein
MGNTAATRAGEKAVGEQQKTQQQIQQERNLVKQALIDNMAGAALGLLSALNSGSPNQNTELKSKIDAVNAGPQKKSQVIDSDQAIKNAKVGEVNTDDLALDDDNNGTLPIPALPTATDPTTPGITDPAITNLTSLLTQLTKGTGVGETPTNQSVPITDTRPYNGAVNESLEKRLPDNSSRIDPNATGTLVTQYDGTKRIDYSDSRTQFIGDNESGYAPVSTGKPPTAKIPSPAGNGNTSISNPPTAPGSTSSTTPASSSSATGKVLFIVSGKEPPVFVGIYQQGSAVGSWQKLPNTQNPVQFESHELPVGPQIVHVVIRYATKLNTDDPGTGGKQHRTTYPDGSVLITEPDGSKRMIKPDGSIQYLGSAGPGNYTPAWRTWSEDKDQPITVTGGTVKPQTISF